MLVKQKTMNTAEEIIKRVDEISKTNFVTARFGDNWREHQKRMLDEGQIDVNMLINLAWLQGRRALLLERAIEELAGVSR